MDRTTLERVFEPFFTTKAPGKGSGLGLSMAFGLMKKHGGYIGIESQPGQGTTVRLLFPVRSASSHTAEARTWSHVGKGSETILVVDDEGHVRNVARRILERYGYRVFTAADGHDALRVIEEHGGKVDLLISDLVMPAMDGRALHRELLETGRLMPVIFMSGYASPEAMSTAVPLDPRLPFLHKPWTARQLLAIVREVLDEADPGTGP